MELTHEETEAVLLIAFFYILAWIYVIHCLSEGLWGMGIGEILVFIIALVWVALITIALLELLVLRVGL